MSDWCSEPRVDAEEKEMNEAQYYASESTAMPTQEELQFLAAEGNALLFADWFKTL